MSENKERICRDYYTETQLESKTFIYTWKITNFLVELSSPGKPITSESFTAVNEKPLWKSKLYATTLPHPSNGTQIIEIQVEFNFGIVVPNIIKTSSCWHFDAYITSNPLYYKVCEKKESIALTKPIIFNINRDYLVNPTNKLLKDGDLIIRFKMCIGTGKVITQPRPVYQLIDSISDNEPISFGFESMLNNSKFSDVKIVIGDKELYVYKGILATRSPVFAAMFEHEMKESIENIIKIEDVDYGIMQEVIRFMYAGKVNNIKNIAKDLLAAADKYEIEELKLKCEKILVNDLKVDTVSSLLVHADKCRAEILRTSALQFFKLHAKEIIQNEKYKADVNCLVPLFPEILEHLVS